MILIALKQADITQPHLTAYAQDRGLLAGAPCKQGPDRDACTPTLKIQKAYLQMASWADTEGFIQKAWGDVEIAHLEMHGPLRKSWLDVTKSQITICQEKPRDTVARHAVCPLVSGCTKAETHLGVRLVVGLVELKHCRILMSTEGARKRSCYVSWSMLHHEPSN